MARNGQTIHSLHDVDGNRIAEYDYNPTTQVSTLLREYIWMNGLPVAVVEGGQIYYVRTDHIGRPVFATDSAGVKVWEVSYLPFGGVHVATGANIDLRFPGQWFQSESGLHQNWMRDYDPTTGRYMQADPLGLADGASVYGYALQNPGRYTDPRGEDAGVVIWDGAGQGSSRFRHASAYVDNTAYTFGPGCAPDVREYDREKYEERNGFRDGTGSLQHPTNSSGQNVLRSHPV